MTDDIEEYLPELSADMLAWLTDIAENMHEEQELWQAVRALIDNLRPAVLAIQQADNVKGWMYRQSIKGPPNSRLHIGEGQTPDAQDVFNSPPQLPARQPTHTVQHRLGKGESGK